MGIVFLIFIATTSFGSCSIEVDISWDFDDDNYRGWANSTSEEMRIETRLQNGELRGIVEGWNPHLDSPILHINTENRHYIVIRLLYYGEALSANLLLRYGPEAYTREQKVSSWNNILRTKAISASSYKTDNSSVVSATDSDFYTLWSSATAVSNWVVLDMSASHWVTGVEIWASGDLTTPRRCLLQHSVTRSGVGPFETSVSFTLSQTSDRQLISGFEGHGRYWRLFIVDTYGGDVASIREVKLNGYDDTIALVPFSVENTGNYKNYYLPIHEYARGPLVQMRLELQHSRKNEAHPLRTRPLTREGLAMDYVRIVRAPEVWRVRGCLDSYYSNATLSDRTFNVTGEVHHINDELPIRFFHHHSLTWQYATTYDCPLRGGISLTIDGLHFGDWPQVTVGGEKCEVMSVAEAREGGRVQSVMCVLPPGSPGLSVVRVQNGVLPGLFQEVPFLSFRTAPSAPAAPIVTNIAACKVDLVWKPPGDMFQHMTVTGYKILWFRPQYHSRVHNTTVGNVTTTSIRGLQPGTEYVFAIAAMSEGAVQEHAASLPTDLYGRRDASAALIGSFSTYSNITATLQYDFNYTFFNANATLNSSATSPSVSDGPTGIFGGEGHYGAVVVGSAHVQNCNVSFTCCDGFNASIGTSSCRSGASVCAVLLGRMLQKEFVVDGQSRNLIESSVSGEEDSPPETVVMSLQELIQIKGAALPTAPCGPALRLTPATARQSGAVWYRRKQNVREGFDTSFSFRISNPSFTCDRLDDVNTRCRSRGADGLAFVLQGVSPTALGSAGKGLGYEGIMNSLAVEVDTYFNYDQLDFYENHISVLTKGWRTNITANHSYALATTTRVPDLTDGMHTLRIRYEPNFNEEDISHPSFQSGGYTSWFLDNADFKYGGQGDWGVGMGMLYVYLDDTHSPVIITPLNLDATLDLDSGRMFVGVTAATGERHWQTHDLLNWTFQSLFLDQRYTPPLIVNGEGAYECVNSTECVHPPDYHHFVRVDHLWGPGDDTTEDWQDGTEGFCSPC